MPGKPLLGEQAEYGSSYSPDLLQPIAREENRRILGLAADLPFHGEDIWNAYELTWLNMRGKPQVSTAELRFPADSPNIIESKSMKLYLDSLSMTRYQGPADVTNTMLADLTRVTGAPITVQLHPLIGSASISEFPGDCIDNLDVDCGSDNVDPDMLGCASDATVSEALYTHLLRSLCPVTGQPDSGSILIRYHGRQIDPGSLLRYIVSYRKHQDFHESCVERIFLDIKKQCGPEQLSVYARYNRRGGLDINPFRSDFEPTAENLRLWRQ
jgi:7-cyano-7-deazaguanine reductase